MGGLVPVEGIAAQLDDGVPSGDGDHHPIARHGDPAPADALLFRRNHRRRAEQQKNRVAAHDFYTFGKATDLIYQLYQKLGIEGAPVRLFAS